MTAIIGHTGFVGSTLSKQFTATGLFNSRNISDIGRHPLGDVVCCAAPAQKWMANRDPVADRRNIETLIAHLKVVSCKTFILISTVDVFTKPLDVDEDTAVDETLLQPYGLHRRLLEKFVESTFPNHLIVRLPGLVGPGLRKNVIFDFLNGNNLQAIDSRGVFQFYPTVNLWYDIRIALRAGLKRVHLTAEPISVSDVSEHGFGMRFTQPLAGSPAIYDMCTRHASLFGTEGRYQYRKRDTLQAIRAYAQSEPRTIEAPSAVAA